MPKLASMLMCSLPILFARCGSPQAILATPLNSSDFVCQGERARSSVNSAGRVWESRYTCASPAGPAIPFGAYLLEVTDAAAHNDGREGVTKISVSPKCIVSFLYMGINYDHRPYREESKAVLQILAARARANSLCH